MAAEAEGLGTRDHRECGTAQIAYSAKSDADASSEADTHTNERGTFLERMCSAGILVQCRNRPQGAGGSDRDVHLATQYRRAVPSSA